MTVFSRRFDVDALSLWAKNNPASAVHALFERWALPGNASTNTTMLRVCVRDGYLNFYANGQSVAKLSLLSGSPEISVHEAYLAAQTATGSADEVELQSQDYVSFSAAKLAMAETATSIASWIATAQTYAGAEKRFVDDLVGSNCNVIDLEMALPAGESIDGETRSAPRMDLVVTQVGAGGTPQIAFWEAKCSTNGELRAEAEYQELNGRWKAGPKVIHQLRKYEAWIRVEGRACEVQAAYRAAARILAGLATVFGKPTCSATGIWDELAAAEMPELILPPGVVVGNYCPAGHVPKTSSEALFASRALSFSRHREKLERHGIRLHEVGDGFNGKTLPRLGALSVSV